MNGHLILIDRYTRRLIMANPEVLFVFGDNLERVGFGGQAKEARGCPNAVGIPTKISPSQYIFDADVELDPDRFKTPILQAFGQLRAHLRQGKNVVWPKDGVGTGLARLPITAPRLHYTITRLMENVLVKEAASVSEQFLQQIEQGDK